MYRTRLFTIPLALLAFINWVFLAPAQQLQRTLATEKGTVRDAEPPHPVSWWTNDLLRLDTSGDLMLGYKAPDGRPLTASDYTLDQKVTTVGAIAGRRIVQILTTIQPGPRVIAAGFAAADQPPTEWQDLLVDAGDGHSYLEIYALHLDGGSLAIVKPAAIYGSGADAILGMYDPDTGNGGGCWDGYWWFDDRGPHEVDFTPLDNAVERAIPAKTTFTPNCWALHPETRELESGVQKIDAECHACGFVGKVHATYRIEHGVVKPVEVSFTAEDE